VKVLIVDHEPKRLEDALHVLEGAGHAVVDAATGSEGLLRAQETRPDLIVLDMALPDISGIDLTKQIKRDPDLAEAYLVLMSGPETPSSIRARGLEAGADAHIVRTASRREFVARIEALYRRKCEEDTLRLSLQEWRTSLDAIKDPMYVVDLKYRIVRCNLALAKFLGVPPSKIVGRRCYELVHGTRKPIADCLCKRAIKSHLRETLTVPMRDGWVQFCVDPILDEDNEVTGTVHLLLDVTERKRLEDALQEARVDVEVLTEERRDALAGMERTLQAEVTARQCAEETLERVRVEMEKQVKALQAGAAERKEMAEETAALQAEVAERQQVEASLREGEERFRVAAAGLADLVYEWDVESGEVRFFSDPHAKCCADPTDFPQTVEQFYGTIHADDRQRVKAALEQHLSAASPEAFCEEYRTTGKDGQIVHWVASGTALRDQDGKARRWIGTAVDVSERRRAEEAKERFVARKYQAQRMEAIALLAGGVAQDLAQLFTVILGSADLALGQLRPSYPLYRDVMAIRRGAKKGADLVGELFAIGRRPVVRPLSLDLNELITGLTKELHSLAGERMDLEVRLAPTLRPVSSAAGAMEQLLMDLGAYARDAMTEGGTLTIKTAEVKLDEVHCSRHPEAHPGDYVRLTVSCVGKGMARTLLERLFEPYRDAEETGVKAGFGLSVAYGIVKQHGGWIDANDMAGQGVGFDIYLPLWKE